jgi:hypothetical protein
MEKQTLNVAPFPLLEWNDFHWAGEVRLSSWAGFQSRRGPYASMSSDDESDGNVLLSIAAENDEPSPLTPEQVCAFQLLLNNEPEISGSILESLI